MNKLGNDLPSMQLLPHQVALVESFFDPASKRVILLRADVGLGKTAAFTTLVTRLLRERPAAKVLLLAPGALRLQFAERLRSAGAPALLVDRFQFREMIESTSEQDLWPSGAVSVLSRDFARQDDVVHALLTTRWDLLIVDEAHQFRGALTAAVLHRIGQASDRVILATPTILSPELPGGFAEGDTTVVQWRLEQVVDLNGARLDSIPRPVLRVTWFELTPAELSLAETVRELCQVFNAGSAKQRLIARSLLRSLQSSPAALENALARVREANTRLVHAPEPSLDGSPEEEPSEDVGEGQPDLSVLANADGIVSRAIDLLEAAGSDSKLRALLDLLEQIDAAETSSTRICVLTEYVNTLYYVAGEIENVGNKTFHPYHAGMTVESRRNYLARFNAGVGGGILAATRAAISSGVGLNKVTDLLLYDVPGSSATLQQLLGQFVQFGRRTPLNVHVILPVNGVDRSRAEYLDLLQVFDVTRVFRPGVEEQQ